jgi:hypothetical protein
MENKGGEMQYMRSLALIGCTFLFLVMGMSGCASIPGKTGEEQTETIDALVERTLADLYKQEPKAKESIANSVGYAVMSNKITKIPLVGAGSGYGVAINTKTEEKTYIKMARFDVGGGWGARSGGVGDKGYTVHMITDAGVSATVTAGVIRVKPVKLKE